MNDGGQGAEGKGLGGPGPWRLPFQWCFLASILGASILGASLLESSILESSFQA